MATITVDLSDNAVHIGMATLIRRITKLDTEVVQWHLFEQFPDLRKIFWWLYTCLLLWGERSSAKSIRYRIRGACTWCGGLVSQSIHGTYISSSDRLWFECRSIISDNLRQRFCSFFEICQKPSSNKIRQDHILYFVFS